MESVFKLSVFAFAGVSIVKFYVLPASESNLTPLLTQPPSYDVAVDLPSYEEAERTKAEEAERAEQQERERRRNQVCRKMSDKTDIFYCEEPCLLLMRKLT